MNTLNLQLILGLAAESRLNIETALRSEPDSREFLASAALVFANTGYLGRADEFANRAAQRFTSDFCMLNIILPTARAAADLHRHEPEAALRELEAVEPYDLSWKTELASIYYRGLAYLQLQRTAEARAQFQKVLDHWAVRPEAAYVPLAHLGLGRMRILEGDKNAARAEYEKFFDLWKDADPDIPVLRQAKAEYSKLG